MNRARAGASVALLAMTALAHAQPPDKQQGRDAAADAEAKFKASDYAGAAEGFKLAYQLDPDPGYIFDIAQAYRLGHDCANAAKYYHEFLEDVPAPPNLDQVHAWLADQQACVDAFVATIAASADADAKAGRYTASAEKLKSAYQIDAAPRHLLEIARLYQQAHDCGDAAAYYHRYLSEAANPPDGDQVRRALRDQEACAGSASAHHDEASPPPAVPPAASSTTPRLAIVAVGASIVALGVAGYFTWDAHHLATLRDTCSEARPCTNAQWSDDNDSGNHAAAIAIAGYAIGALAGGAALYVWLHRPHEAPIAIAPTRGGALVSAGFAF